MSCFDTMVDKVPILGKIADGSSLGKMIDTRTASAKMVDGRSFGKMVGSHI